jgi:hypothetical protein|tara:strand:+ start:667 stop:897 length:231 start_codon:yes stop_codon:yes gene_type:complete
MTEVFIGTDYWQNLTATWGNVTFPATWDGLTALTELTISVPTYNETSIASTSFTEPSITSASYTEASIASTSFTEL